MMQDVWTVAPDGRVARVVPSPYRVEWYRDDALTARGPVVDFEPVPVARADRDAYWAARATQSPGRAAITGPPGRGSAGAEAPRRSSQPGAITEADFPNVKPPFIEEYAGTVARVSPEGELWVARAAASGDPVSVIDVFDAAGRRVRVVTLPPHRSLLGFGRGVVYTLRVDSDGLQWLERYRR
jgi:hypothetical protein